MDELLKNKSLYLGTEDLRGYVANQATNLVINQIKKDPQFSQHDVRKCQSENKLKKYDYLGGREFLYAEQQYKNIALTKP